jgi:hypothetical protein
MKKKFQSKSPFIQMVGWCVLGSLSPKTTTMVGPIHATLLSTQASKQASEQSSHTFGRLLPVIKYFLFPKDLILP